MIILLQKEYGVSKKQLKKFYKLQNELTDYINSGSKIKMNNLGTSHRSYDKKIEQYNRLSKSISREAGKDTRLNLENSESFVNSPLYKTVEHIDKKGKANFTKALEEGQKNMETATIKVNNMVTSDWENHELSKINRDAYNKLADFSKRRNVTIYNGSDTTSDGARFANSIYESMGPVSVNMKYTDPEVLKQYGYDLSKMPQKFIRVNSNSKPEILAHENGHILGYENYPGILKRQSDASLQAYSPQNNFLFPGELNKQLAVARNESAANNYGKKLLKNAYNGQSKELTNGLNFLDKEQPLFSQIPINNTLLTDMTKFRKQ